MTADDAFMILHAAEEETVERAALRLGSLVLEWNVEARLRALAEGSLNGCLRLRLDKIGVTRSMLTEMGVAFRSEGREHEARERIHEVSQRCESIPRKIDVQLRSGALVPDVWSDAWECFKEQMLVPPLSRTRRNGYRLFSGAWCAFHPKMIKAERLDRLARALEAFTLDGEKNNARQNDPEVVTVIQGDADFGRAEARRVSIESQGTKTRSPMGGPFVCASRLDIQI